MQSDIIKLLEAILLVYGEPINIKKLSKITKKPENALRDSLERLKGRLKNTSGLRIVEKDGYFQLVSAKEYSKTIEKLFKAERREELTKAALEVLAIITYRGPVNRVEIETIRGVNSAYILRNLQLRGLIKKIDKAKQLVGQYELSFNALRYLGLEKQEDLPNWQAIRQEIDKVKETFS